MIADQELRDLVASVAETQKRETEETNRRFREVEQLLVELAVEADRRQDEAKGLLSELAGEVKRQQAETAQLQRENAQQQRENAQQQRETDRQLREVGRQLGALGDKFGSFTEGMALPAMTKILTERFGMTVVAPRVRSRRNGRSMEVDVLAYSNSQANAAYVVEVKSHLREDGLDQILRILSEFREFFPEHAGKKLYGILAAVDMSDNVAAKALREGIYLARIHDDQFEIQVPTSFEPRAY